MSCRLLVVTMRLIRIPPPRLPPLTLCRLCLPTGLRLSSCGLGMVFGVVLLLYQPLLVLIGEEGLVSNMTRGTGVRSGEKNGGEKSKWVGDAAMLYSNIMFV